MSTLNELVVSVDICPIGHNICYCIFNTNTIYIYIYIAYIYI